MTCQWHRYIDYQPFTGNRDIGSLQWEGELLIEWGVEANYREEWQRLDDGQSDFTALTLAAVSSSQPWQGCLVTAGDYFIYVYNRAIALPPADTLTTLLTSATPDQRVTYLDCEISFGVCRSGTVPWEIRLSTLPWKQGRSLWNLANLQLDPDQGHILQTTHHDNESQTQHWKIQEWGTGIIFESP